MRTAAILVLSLTLTGCFCDEFEKTNSVPVVELRDKVEARVHNSPARSMSDLGPCVAHGSFLYLVERYAGLHIIDNSNPSTPRKLSFLQIPGNYHVAIAKDILIADNSTDIVTFDLQDPAQPRFRERRPKTLNWLPAPHLVNWGYDSIVSIDNGHIYYSRTLHDNEMVTGYRDTTIKYDCYGEK
jgi:hypothetical protein